MKVFLHVVVVSLMATGAYAAQLYRWVDAKGNVEWRDTPPPASVPSKSIQERRVGGNVIGTTETPYAVQLAAKNHPVKLWTGAGCGAGCDAARAHLAKRGVPYTESSPEADSVGFSKASPNSQVPILQVGSQSLTGYLESDWDITLDSAGYPRSGPAVKPVILQPPATPPAAAAKPPATAAAPNNPALASPPPAK